MKVSLDHEGCISCGLCVSTCPEVFRFAEDSRAEAKCEEVPKGCEDQTEQSAIGCPVSVISTTK